jgi:cytochrome c-type biogenesis protein CcmF
MTPELGHFALVLALGLGLIQSIVPVMGVHRRDGSLMRLASSTALAQFIFVALSFLALTVCYVT